MSKRTVGIFLTLSLLFQPIEAGNGFSKVICAIGNGFLAFATCGASMPLQAAAGVGITTTAVNAAAMFSGQRSPTVPMILTERGPEHVFAAEQRTLRERHFADYARRRAGTGYREIRQTCRNANDEELATELTVNRLFPGAEEDPPASQELREALGRIAAEDPSPEREAPTFADLLSRSLEEDRISGELSPVLYFGEMSIPTTLAEFLSPVNDHLAEDLGAMPSFPIGDGIRLSGNVDDFADAGGPVNDFTAVAGGEAEHMSPEEMRENFPDAWNYAAERVQG
ncbi:MAG: hypothetical protein LBO73_01745, partial [Holosporaceae bacterium]|nr:hypothetical protein [Holosporaceae bacterium]